MLEQDNFKKILFKKLVSYQRAQRALQNSTFTAIELVILVQESEGQGPSGEAVGRG